MSRYLDVPILGKVTAGAPILAVENIEGYFPLPEDFARNKEIFMLAVSGDSMINAGILDGDYVIVQKQNIAKNGDIVVALIEDEATVKTFYSDKNGVRLQPQNDAYEPIIAKNVEVLGKVTGIFRKLKVII
jgi:repressor LexA